MKLTLSEAARALGKSERQVRYLIDTDKLAARKADDGRWIIRQEDLPLSEGQRQAAQQKAERARKLAAEVLQPQPSKGGKKSFSVRKVRAFQEGAPLYRDLKAEFGDDHPATALVREALMLVGCGYNEFEAPRKAEFYGRAREQASRAAVTLLLDDDDHQRGALLERLEGSLLPALGGLIHQAERRGRAS